MRDNCPMTLMSCSLHCSDLLFDIRLVTLENAWRRELNDMRRCQKQCTDMEFGLKFYVCEMVMCFLLENNEGL